MNNIFSMLSNKKLKSFLKKYSLPVLRISLGIIFFWFGVLKFFPHLSPAEDLAVRTITKLCWGVLSPSVILFLLATWESVIGLGLIFKVKLKFIIVILLIQMFGTFLPFVFFPNEIFATFPYALTLEGQYIFKNIVLVSSALVIAASL